MACVRCIETGRGPKGSTYVCETPEGSIVLKAVKTAPYKYDVYSEYPRGRFKTVIRARRRGEVRRRIEEWLEYLMECSPSQG